MIFFNLMYTCLQVGIIFYYIKLLYLNACHHVANLGSPQGICAFIFSNKLHVLFLIDFRSKTTTIQKNYSLNLNDRIYLNTR